MRHSVSCCSLLLILSTIPTYSQVFGIVEGDVVNEATGKPVAGARIKLENHQSSEEPIYTRADDQGHFTFGKLARGVYSLDVESPGFKNAYGSVNVAPPVPPGRARGMQVPPPSVKEERSVEPDGTIHVKEAVSLRPLAVITGLVTDPIGIPIAGSEVELVSTRAQQFGHGGNRADDRGEYRIFDVEPGTYYIAANKPQGMGPWEPTFVPTFFPGVVDMSSAKAVEVGPGQTVRADIRVVSIKGARVFGRLIKPAGQQTSPLVYTNVVLVRESNRLLNPNGPFTTGRDEYELKSVPPGRYTLSALSRDAGSDPLGNNQKELYGLTRQIEVPDADLVS